MTTHADPVVEGEIQAPDPIRQSSIARFDNCAMSLLLEHQAPPEAQPGNMAARGTLFHAWAAKALTIMRAEGETRFPVEQGLELLLDVLAQRDVPDEDVVHLPMRELKWLRVLVTRWCEWTSRGNGFNAARIIAIEERLYMQLKVPDGQGGTYDRTITGQPDVLVADPGEENGIIVPDWKSGWAPPARLQDEDRHAREQGSADHAEKLSDQGYAQQIMYGALVLANFPTVDRVTLREAYIMAGEIREATVWRHQLERVLDILGAVVAQIDAAFHAGPDSRRWVPTAGTHCAICPSPRRCPIKDWEGIPADEEEARVLAREWIVAGEVRKNRLPLVKGWVDAAGPISIDTGKGRRQVGWVPNATGDGRRFVLHEPDDAPVSPFDERLAETRAAS